MEKSYKLLYNYLKNPVLVSYKDWPIQRKIEIFFHFILFCIAIGFLSSPFLFLLEKLTIVNTEQHKVAELFKDLSFAKALLLGGLLVPIVEELIFRAPLPLFKNPKYFRIAFYFFALSFGFIHISNFSISLSVLLVAPLLVLPQIVAGFVLGFLRVVFGLQWSIFFHCTFNAILITLTFIGNPS